MEEINKGKGQASCVSFVLNLIDCGTYHLCMGNLNRDGRAMK